jgi:hypothetical protein
MLVQGGLELRDVGIKIVIARPDNLGTQLSDTIF